MNIKQKLHDDRAKIKELHGKERRQYIIDYYKYHILVAILLVLFIVYVFYTIFKPRTDVALSCGVINQNVNEDWVAEYEDKIEDELGFTDSKCTFDTTYSFMVDGSGSSYNAASLGKMSVNIQQGLMDMLVVTQDFIDYYQDLNRLWDLSDLMPQDLYSKLGDKLYTQTTQYGDKFACAIDITGTELYEAMNTDEKLYICVVYNSPHKDNVISYLEYLFR